MEFAAPGQQSRFADVAGQHVRPLDLADRGARQPCDGVFDRAFFQPDAEVARQQFDDVFGLQGRRASEQIRDEFHFALRAGRAGQRFQERRHLRQRQDGSESGLRRGRKGFQSHVACVPQSDQALSHVRLVRACDAQDGGEQGRATDIRGALVAQRKSVAGEVAGGVGQVVIEQPAEVGAQRGGFLQTPGGRADLLGGFGEAEEGGGVHAASPFKASTCSAAEEGAASSAPTPEMGALIFFRLIGGSGTVVSWQTGQK